MVGGGSTGAADRPTAAWGPKSRPLTSGPGPTWMDTQKATTSATKSITKKSCFSLPSELLNSTTPYSYARFDFSPTMPQQRQTVSLSSTSPPSSLLHPDGSPCVGNGSREPSACPSFTCRTHFLTASGLHYRPPWALTWIGRWERGASRGLDFTS